MTTESGYTANNMQVLEGLEAVRKRPGMYIGSTDSKGLNHLVWEIVDNAVDEALANYAHHINISLHADGSVTVEDDGRGIPVDVNTRSGLSGVELAFTKLHAGGKFSSGSYKAAGGLHGVGASVVNALSSRLDVTVYRGGKQHDISFQRGASGVYAGEGEAAKFTPKAGLRAGSDTRSAADKKARSTGTTVRWWHDRSIFLKDASLDLTAILTRARQTAFLVPGLGITVSDTRDAAHPQNETFRFEGGLVDMVEYIALGESLHKPIHLTGSGTFQESVPVLDEQGHMVTQDVDRDVEVDVALAYNNGYETQVRSFVNVVNTPNGGTHVKGLEDALTKVLVDGIKSTRGLLKANEANPIIDDIREGLTVVISVNVPEPQFIGQTKDELGTAAVRKVVRAATATALSEFLSAKKNANTAKQIYGKVVDASRVRLTARKERETARRKTSLESASMPAKLLDSAINDARLSELQICEGDSALGGLLDARDSRYQAILPLRGKILNVQNLTLGKALENAEVASLVQVIGAGVGKSFDLSRMRYGRVLSLTDADADGSHIRALLIAFFWKFMRPLVEDGRLYAAVPPLFSISTGGRNPESHYALNTEERDKIVASLEKRGKTIANVQRHKGLGEYDQEILWNHVLNPETRTLRQVTVEDAIEAERMIELAMGPKAEPRKAWITTQRSLLTDEDIDA